jgi:hypothetical protein
MQIMEIKARFNLNAAIQNWHLELAAQPLLTPEDRRELESHLRESIAALRQSGLNEEESFWLARRRLGRPQPLAAEFVKEEPARVWRKRLFWMLMAPLAFQLWCFASSTVCLMASNYDRFLPQWLAFSLPPWLQDLCRAAGSGSVLLAIVFSLPMVALLVAFVLGRASRRASTKRSFLLNRGRFLSVTAILVLAVHILNAAVTYMAQPLAGHFSWQISSLQVITTLVLVGVLAWILPSRANKASTQVEAG